MTRRANDFYPTTHEGAVLGLLHQAPIGTMGGTVLECCSGEHHITKVLRRETELFDRVFTNDVVPSCEADFHEDAREARVWREVFPVVDWVITNPPFGVAVPILKNALAHARLGVAFYLRITFWEPTMKDREEWKRRGPLLKPQPPTGFMPMSRISHTEDGGTDSATCAWFVWERDRTTQWHQVLILDEDAASDESQGALLLEPPPGESGVELHGPEALSAISKAYTRVCR